MRAHFDQPISLEREGGGRGASGGGGGGGLLILELDRGVVLENFK